MKKKQFKSFVQLLKNSEVDKELDIEKFKSALSEVDSQMKNLPATAQVNLKQLISGTVFSFLISSFSVL